MRIVTVVGARPQFVKCAVVSRALRRAHREFLLHTGQHHDYGMSEIFFEELGIPEPDLNLGIAGGTHGQMTGRMLEQIEGVLLDQAPDWVLVYGDTNSTLAAALAASKLHIPVAHVEAGLRSFNRRMPEEINRIVTDHVATLCLCPTENARALLEREGRSQGVHNVGDVMFDSVLENIDRAEGRFERSSLLASLAFSPDAAGRYAIATLHRPENTEDLSRLGSILEGLSAIDVPVLLPLHPRTRRVLERNPGLAGRAAGTVRIVDPVGYLELLLLLDRAALVLTDSGGIQKEAFFLGVRCVTLRDETEWIETVALGANAVVGAGTGAIIAAATEALGRGRLPIGALTAASGQTGAPGPFGDGHAAEKIVALLERSGTA